MIKFLTKAGILEIENIKQVFFKEWGLCGDIMVKKDGKLRKKINTIIYGSKSEGLYWNQRKRARKTYEEIGTDEGLNKETLSRYTYYMMKRWGGSEELKWDMLLNGQIVLRWG